MASADEVASMIAAIGPNDPDIEEVIEIAANDYVIRFGDLVVTVEYEPESERLVFSADLGNPPADKQLEIFRTLLQFSLLWRDTGGVHVALDAEDHPVQMVTLFGEELTVDFVGTVIRNFARMARLIRAYVAVGGDSKGALDAISEAYLRV